MWNSDAPLELLNEMPAQLNRANLERIQSVIDIDKFRESYEQGRDLCGEYAPFCALCDKSIETPCAVAYVKMKQAEGMEVEIAAANVAEEPVVEERPKKRIRIAIARRRITPTATVAEIPSDVEETPSETPAEVDEIPSKVAETPVEVDETSTEIAETSTEFDETSTEVDETETDISETGADTEEE